MALAYSGKVKIHLKSIDFDASDIPKHVLGFHCDYELTKQRIDQYYDDVEEHVGVDKEWIKWNNLSDLEKEAHEQTIRMLKFQQKWLKQDTSNSTAAAADSPPVVRRMSTSTVVATNDRRKTSVAMSSPVAKTPKTTLGVAKIEKVVKRDWIDWSQEHTVTG
jgi:hypothetical protein